MSLRLLAAWLGIVVILGLAAYVPAQDKSSSAQSKGQGGPTSKAPKGKSHATSPKDQPDADAPKDEADGDASKGKTDGDTAKGKTETDASKGKTDARAIKVKTEKATFGGGCFWCQEAVFERITGVKSVVSGYAGGTVPYPTYEMVHTGLSGHAEVVQIEYDPAVVTYEKLLKVFFAAHDPTTVNSQADDFGPQYRSIILYSTEEQKEAALKMYKDLTARKVFRSPIVTELVPLTVFYPAEPYHQNYYRNNRYSDYSQIHITPKLKKLKLK